MSFASQLGSEAEDAFFELLNSQGGDCKYYDIDSFNNKFAKTNNSKFSVISFNIRSFYKNSDEFIGFLSNLKFKFHIIILTETWLSDKNIELCNISGYTGIHCVRKNKQGGGVSLFIHNSLTFKRLNNYSISNDLFESVGVSVDISREVSLNVLGIYRPPGGNLDLFSDSFFNFVNENNLTTGKTIISGDLNFCILKHNECVITNNLINDFFSNSFYPTIHIPTRVCDNTRSLIDHFWLDLLFPSTSGVFINDITDHYPIFLILDLPISSNDKKVNIEFRDFSSKNERRFSNLLPEVRWLDLINNINESTNNFLHKIESLYKSCFPLLRKQVTVKRLSNPWLTRGILSSIKNKNRLFKLLKSNLITKSYYNKYRNNLTSIIRTSKKKLFSIYFYKI